MPLQTKAIKTKIGSVKNIKKITRAMEMVAVSKMKRAVDRTLATREYTERALELLVALRREREIEHPLLEEGRGTKTLLVVVASNKGLCGGFNVTLAKAVSKYVYAHGGPELIDFVTIGRNAEKLARKLNAEVRGSFIQLPEQLGVEDIRGIMRIIVDEFTGGMYKNVAVAYNNYVSAISYRPLIREIVPVNPAAVSEAVDDIGKDVERVNFQKPDRSLFLFEPDPESVAAEVIPRLVEIQVYQGIVESLASEHSARMFAMKNATDNAQKLVDKLTLSFNQARQSGITQEISEIAAGANALG